MSFSNVLNNRKRVMVFGTVGTVSALALVGGGLASLTAIDKLEGHELRAGVNHAIEHVTSDTIDADVSPGADLSRNYSIQGQNTGAQAGHVAFRIEDGTAVAEEFSDAVLDQTLVYIYFHMMGTDGLAKDTIGSVGKSVTLREFLTFGFMMFPDNPAAILQPGETFEVSVGFVPAEDASQWEASAVGDFAARFTSVLTLSAVDGNGRSDLAAYFLDQGQEIESGIYVIPESEVLDASGTEAQRIETTVSVTDPAE